MICLSRVKYEFVKPESFVKTLVGHLWQQEHSQAADRDGLISVLLLLKEFSCFLNFFKRAVSSY